MNHGNPKPFVNGANKIAYYFDEGMTTEEWMEALLDVCCHSETEDEHVCENGEIYRIVRVSRRPSGDGETGF